MRYADIERLPVVLFYNGRILKGDSRLIQVTSKEMMLTPQPQHGVPVETDTIISNLIHKVSYLRVYVVVSGR